MPDGPWENLDAASSDAHEAEYDDPDNTYSSPTRTDTSQETQQDGTRVTTKRFTISHADIEGHTVGVQLVHKCNRCGGHTHSLRALEGFKVEVPYTPLHVADDHFGQGMGTLYDSVKVTGELVRRIETRTTPAGGGAPQVDVTWRRRTLDHIEDRDLVELEPFATTVDCTLNVDESSLGFDWPETDHFALALARVPDLPDDVGWMDEGRVLPDLAEALAGVERPLFRFRRGGEEAEMVLVSRAGGETKELGRVTLEVSKDGRLVTAKRYTPSKG